MNDFCPRSAKKNPVDTAYDVGSVVSVLADVGSSSQLRSVVSLWFLFGTGCLEGGKLNSDVVGVADCTILAIIVFLGRPPSATVHSTFCDPLLPNGATTISLRPRWRPIRLFLSEALAAPIKVRQLLVLPPVTS
ncbi:hypothetical protein TNCV_2552911 [Trichonephila clavipes]|nr:hypothetical protein TNCV_2552911 [Trichonephila clavipes]